MPNYDAEFLEMIVQEVIRRLTGAGISVTKNGKPQRSLSAAQTDTKTELVLSDRLITLATLQGRLDGIGSLVVNRKSLVTPAVRDELNRRNIQLRKE
jgi:hypothetical protein